MSEIILYCSVTFHNHFRNVKIVKKVTRSQNVGVRDGDPSLWAGDKEHTALM